MILYYNYNYCTVKCNAFASVCTWLRACFCYRAPSFIFRCLICGDLHSLHHAWVYGVNDNVHRSHRTHRQLAGRTQPHAASPNNTRPRRASRHTGLSQCNACASLYCHHDQRLQPTPVRVYGASARPQRIPAPAPMVLLPPTTTRPPSPGRVTPRLVASSARAILVPFATCQVAS